MKREPTEDDIILALSEQLDPANIATLKGPYACNRRLNRCMYYLNQGGKRGLSLEFTLDRAMSTYQHGQHRESTKKSLLKNYRRMKRFGCFEDGNDLKLRKSASASATKGPYAGDTMVVDHVIPRSLAPSLANEFFNLLLIPKADNSSKSDRLDGAMLKVARIFAEHGLIRQEMLGQIEELTVAYGSFRAAARGMPDVVAAVRAALPFSQYIAALNSSPAVPALSGRSVGMGAAPLDPAIVVRTMQDLHDRIKDWEPRADHARENCQTTWAHTQEHTARSKSLLALALNDIAEDAGKLLRMEAELGRMHDRWSEGLSLARRDLGEAEEIVALAAERCGYWHGELALARDWLVRAAAREESARDDVARAEEELEEAKQELAEALAELEEAKRATEPAGTDKEGNTIYAPIDTTPYRDRVREMREIVARCRDNLAEAREDLTKARKERRAAQDRVNSAQQAWKTTIEAEQEAGLAQTRASASVVAVERASEEHARASAFTKDAGVVLASLRTEAEHMEGEVNTAELGNLEAGRLVNRIHSHQEESRSRSVQGRFEIATRAEILRNFNRPMQGF